MAPKKEPKRYTIMESKSENRNVQAEHAGTQTAQIKYQSSTHQVPAHEEAYCYLRINLSRAVAPHRQKAQFIK